MIQLKQTSAVIPSALLVARNQAAELAPTLPRSLHHLVGQLLAKFRFDAGHLLQHAHNVAELLLGPLALRLVRLARGEHQRQLAQVVSGVIAQRA